MRADLDPNARTLDPSEDINESNWRERVWFPEPNDTKRNTQSQTMKHELSNTECDDNSRPE